MAPTQKSLELQPAKRKGPRAKDSLAPKEHEAYSGPRDYARGSLDKALKPAMALQPGMRSGAEGRSRCTVFESIGAVNTGDLSEIGLTSRLLEPICAGTPAGFYSDGCLGSGRVLLRGQLP